MPQHRITVVVFRTSNSIELRDWGFGDCFQISKLSTDVLYYHFSAQISITFLTRSVNFYSVTVMKEFVSVVSVLISFFVNVQRSDLCEGACMVTVVENISKIYGINFCFQGRVKLFPMLRRSLHCSVWISRKSESLLMWRSVIRLACQPLIDFMFMFVA
jgi:hypothetical protein